MRLKIGSTYQKAVTIIEKLKEGNASIFICGKSGTGKTTLSSDIIIRNLLESGVRIVVIDHRHAVSLPADLEPYVHRQDVSQKPLKLHLFGTSANPADASASFVDTVASVIRLSDGQKPLLLSLLEKVLRDSPAPNEALERLHLEIQNSRSLAAPGLEKALTPLWGQKFFENGDFEIFSGITLLELDSFPPSTQHIVEEVVFAALLREATREDFPPTFLYLDELSNFPLHQTSALGKILNEGRKYGLYCLLVAQSICNFKAGQRILLQQCKYAMYFQPADDEIRMCARFISSSGGTKLTSMLKSLQVGEFLVSGPVYVGDSDTPTTKPLVVHSKPPEDVVPASDSPTIPMPSDTEPILPPAQIDFLPPLDELDGCDDCNDEDSTTQNNEFEPVTEDVYPPLPSSSCELSSASISPSKEVSEPPKQDLPTSEQIIASIASSNRPRSCYDYYSPAWPQTQPIDSSCVEFDFSHADFSSLVRKDDKRFVFTPNIKP